MLETKYNYKEVEKGKYENWRNSGYFNSGDITKKPFCIVIPPPNVTGKLHLGHAWDTTLQDIVIRYKRMDGYDALWLPGMDHAGIATQAKIDKKLKDLGIKPREMSRTDWLKHAWDWKEEYASNIRSQWAKLGLSLDYTKERFTLDKGLNQAVNNVFVTLYNEGLIYRGERIINWDPDAMTALSNEEVIYKDTLGYEHYFKYYFVDNPNEYLTIMTTRPETIFGDGAIAVHPDDERYKHLVGKKVLTPLANNPIPIITDKYVDIEKGSGCVKITPAHDPNDYEVGLRHNIRKDIIMDTNGKMSVCPLVPSSYQGLDRYDARRKFITDAKEKGLLLKMDKVIHSVGHSERTGAIIEPYLSKQWFVKMRPLADKVLENQKDKKAKVNFIPHRFEKIMNHWMEITYDWCISRQLWWGHPIPAWYKSDEVYVGINPPKEEGWVQDEDVLDTWFSSALWPFSTLGWPDETEELKRYYPNDLLVTAYDIIPFWVNRMTFEGLHFFNERPFKEVLIHGLIRDKEGRKMSKSLGNGIDPMDVIENFGCDSLRYFLTTSSAPGMDLRYDEEKVSSTWNFINKLWNAARFCLMNMENFKEENYSLEEITDEDKWIITKLNQTIKEVRKNMEKYEFNNVGSILYSFVWDDFCDSYIEFAKFNLNENTTKSTLYYVLISIIKMLHPFMPYVTDEIYNMLPFKDSENIMISKYPTYNEKLIFKKEKDFINNQIEFIKIFRNFKAENKISKDYQVFINGNIDDYNLIIQMLKLKDNIIDKSLDKTKFNISFNIFNIDIYYEKVETKEEKNLRFKQIESLKNSIQRRKNLLNNENYVNKAPENLIILEKIKLEEEKNLLAKLMKM